MILALAILLCSFPQAADPPGGALDGARPRVIVSSDIGGGDPDDFQSMVHLLVYADVLDIEGLISSPPGEGRVEHVHEVIDAYERDYRSLRYLSRNYPRPSALRAMTRQGAIDPAPAAGFSEPTEGSRLIIARAKARDSRPLYILVWGGITDVAQAVHDDPSIKRRIRVYSTGAWNTRHDQASHDYLYNHHRDLWWIDADTTFRGMYVGGKQEDDLGNREFVERYVRGHGELGDFFARKKADIKMGDTPTLLYLLRGNPDDPTAESWGGSFVRSAHGRHYWTDDRRPELKEGPYAGAKTVNRWREGYLRDWQARMSRL